MSLSKWTLQDSNKLLMDRAVELGHDSYLTRFGLLRGRDNFVLYSLFPCKWSFVSHLSGGNPGEGLDGVGDVISFSRRVRDYVQGSLSFAVSQRNQLFVAAFGPSTYGVAEEPQVFYEGDEQILDTTPLGQYHLGSKVQDEAGVLAFLGKIAKFREEIEDPFDFSFRK